MTALQDVYNAIPLSHLLRAALASASGTTPSRPQHQSLQGVPCHRPVRESMCDVQAGFIPTDAEPRHRKIAVGGVRPQVPGPTAQTAPGVPVPDLGGLHGGRPSRAQGVVQWTAIACVTKVLGVWAIGTCWLRFPGITDWPSRSMIRRRRNPGLPPCGRDRTGAPRPSSWAAQTRSRPCTTMVVPTLARPASPAPQRPMLRSVAGRRILESLAGGMDSVEPVRNQATWTNATPSKPPCPSRDELVVTMTDQRPPSDDGPISHAPCGRGLVPFPTPMACPRGVCQKDRNRFSTSS